MSSFASGKFAYLVNKLTPAWTMIIDRNIWVTKGRLYLVNDNQVEWISFSGISGSWSSYTLSGVVRDIDPVTIPATSDSTGKTWLANQRCILVAMHDQIKDFSLSVELPNYANATDRDTTITSPLNGMMVYNNGTGTIQQYISGAWSDIATGSVVNATTGIAGKVQIPTQIEVNNGTAIGWSGASLAVAPDTLKVLIDTKLTNDARINTTITVTSPPSSSGTFYSSGVHMTRWGWVSLSFNAFSNPYGLSAWVETSVDWSTGWTDTGYWIGAGSGSSTFVPVKGWVYVRVKILAQWAISSGVATGVVFY